MNFEFFTIFNDYLESKTKIFDLYVNQEKNFSIHAQVVSLLNYSGQMLLTFIELPNKGFRWTNPIKTFIEPHA